ncbi:MAG TPA: aldose 1-epimerase family protein [Acidimicrobiales bacterium]|nr:aldose 1-epimerase family protein [Acidimicrobiales bacterium]
MSDPSSGHPAVSGAQHQIGHGLQRVVVSEVGATLREFTVDGRVVVDGFGPTELCRGGRGQVLAPWPNRLGDGRYEFDGTSAQAALDEPARHNAIHGLVRWLPWQLLSRGQNVVLMGCVLHPQPGYPWRIDLQVEYRLGSAGLSVSATATNVSGNPAPFGIGFHPYLTVGTPTIDTARLRLDARRRLVTDERGLPTGSASVVGTDFDFSNGRLIGATRLDTAFFDLARDDAGIARVELDQPGGASASVWMDERFPYVMAFSADTVEVPRRRESLAVEPMSCPPDALRSGTDLTRLEPGASWSGRWGISTT